MYKYNGRPSHWVELKQQCGSFGIEGCIVPKVRIRMLPCIHATWCGDYPTSGRGSNQ